MAVTEEERHELYSWIEGQAGPQIAATLMKHLPPVGWMDVTTNTELEKVRRELVGRIDGGDAKTGQMEASLSARMDQLEAKSSAGMDQVDASLSARMDQLEAELSAGMDQVDASLSAGMDRAEVALTSKIDVEVATLRTAMSDGFERQTRVMILAMVGSMATMTSLVVAAVGLAG